MGIDLGCTGVNQGSLQVEEALLFSVAARTKRSVDDEELIDGNREFDLEIEIFVATETEALGMGRSDVDIEDGMTSELVGGAIRNKCDSCDDS